MPRNCRRVTGPQHPPLRIALLLGRSCAHIPDRSQHCLLNRQSRPPAQGSNPRAVEKDKWTIANPPSFASRVRELGAKAEILTNPADRVVDFAILVCPEIEDVNLALRLVDGCENRVDAILHVQV